MKSLALSSLNAMHQAAGYLPKMGNFRPLRGTFSAYEALQKGHLKGQIIQERQAPGKCPPGSMTEKAAFQQHDHQPWPVFWTRADDAHLIGNMFHWRNPRDELCLEAVYQHPRRLKLREDTFTAQTLLPKIERLEGAWTSIASNWNDGKNYYHWLLDGLTRLAVRDHFPEDTKIIIPENTSPYVTETIHLLGLTKTVFSPKSRAVAPEKFYFSAPTAMTGVYNPLGYDWLRKSFAKYLAPQNSGNPIFLTRRGNARIPANLHALENLFTSKGFEILDCGSLKVQEQIHKVSAAPAIAGLHGAAMTNILWAAKGTPVLELFQPNYLNGCYEQIAFHGELDYTATVITTDKPLKGTEEWLLDHSL